MRYLLKRCCSRTAPVIFVCSHTVALDGDDSGTGWGGCRLGGAKVVNLYDRKSGGPRRWRSSPIGGAQLQSAETGGRPGNMRRYGCITRRAANIDFKGNARRSPSIRVVVVPDCCRRRRPLRLELLHQSQRIRLAVVSSSSSSVVGCPTPASSVQTTRSRPSSSPADLIRS
uniref:Secreted protein n=1 Tax=Plectus sambesii TaxID=2011161 RepID=A0A914WQM1_9BILA